MWTKPDKEKEKKRMKKKQLEETELAKHKM
jgi:hypothetical protein